MPRKTAAAAAAAAAAPDVDSSSGPDFASLVEGATAPANDAGAATALDELAAQISDTRVPGDTFGDDLGDDYTVGPGEMPEKARARQREAISSSEPPRRKRGRPARTDGGRSRSGEPRTTKTELLAEVEQLRGRLEAAEARADTDKVAELAQSFRMLSHVGFALLAEARGPHWRTTPDEDTRLGESFAVAAAPHAEKIEEALPWAAPVLALVGIVGQRVIEDVRIARLRAPVAVTDGPALGTGPVSAP